MQLLNSAFFHPIIHKVFLTTDRAHLFKIFFFVRQKFWPYGNTAYLPPPNQGYRRKLRSFNIIF
jgi:hypothetical protein